MAAAIRPQSYGSSTTGVKKSAVTTTAAPSVDPDDGRVVAVVEPDEQVAGRRGRPAQAGDSTASSSPGGILQAQPPPCGVLGEAGRGVAGG